MKTAEVVSLQRYIEVRFPQEEGVTFGLSYSAYNDLMDHLYPIDDDHFKVFFLFHDICTNTKRVINLRNACYIKDIPKGSYKEPERPTIEADVSGHHDIIIHTYGGDIFVVSYAHDLTNKDQFNTLVNKFIDYDMTGDYVKIDGAGNESLHIKYSEVDRIEIK